MEYVDNILCVTREELTSGDDPVIKATTLRQNVARKHIECVNRGGGEGNVALVFLFLPSREVQETLG